MLGAGRQLHAAQVPCDEIDAIRCARRACAQPEDGRRKETGSGRMAPADVGCALHRYGRGGTQTTATVRMKKSSRLLVPCHLFSATEYPVVPDSQDES